MWIDRLLHPVLERNTVLRDHVLDLKRLPPIGIDEFGAGRADGERRVDRVIPRRGISLAFVGAVDQSCVQDHACYSIAERCGRVALDRCDIDRVAEILHETIEFRDRFGRADRIDVARLENSEGRVARGFVAGSFYVRDTLLLGDEDPGRFDVIGCPRIPHGCRGVIEIPGVNGRSRKIAANGVEQHLVPATSN